MERVLGWIKEKWIWILGVLGVLVIALGSIFSRKKVVEDKTASLHENRMTGLDTVKRIEKNASEAVSAAEQKYEEKRIEIEKDERAQIENLKDLEQIDLTEIVADRFEFKNGDKQ